MRTKAEVLRRVKAVVADEFGRDIDQVTKCTDLFEDLGADSLDLFDVLSKLETEYDVYLSPDQYHTSCTVRDILNVIMLELEKKHESQH